MSTRGAWIGIVAAVGVIAVGGVIAKVAGLLDATPENAASQPAGIPWSPVLVPTAGFRLELPGELGEGSLDGDLTQDRWETVETAGATLAEGRLYSLCATLEIGELRSSVQQQVFDALCDGFRQVHPATQRIMESDDPVEGHPSRQTVFELTNRRVGFQQLILNGPKLIVVRFYHGGQIEDDTDLRLQLVRSFQFDLSTATPAAGMVTDKDPLAAFREKHGYEAAGPGTPKRIRKDAARAIDTLVWTVEKSDSREAFLTLSVMTWQASEKPEPNRLEVFARSHFDTYTANYQKLARPNLFEVEAQTWQGMPARQLRTAEGQLNVRRMVVYTPEGQLRIELAYTDTDEPAGLWDQFLASVRKTR